jgi:putative flavoprotein involved in K+ transport
MPMIDTVVIGAGQAGLAASRCLAERDIDHVVLERGRVAERWRSERWDSLRLLTPNWMSRLPGWSYAGPDPNGFMTATDVTAFLQGYADAFAAPVIEDSNVIAVSRDDDCLVVATTADRWQAANVVIATGWSDLPAVPSFARNIDASIVQMVPSAYRNPDSLPDGGVLVVGASATGAQLADELIHAGRRVVLAVGSHTRLPRRYRGMDIFWWLQGIGSLDRSIDELPNPDAARHEPSLQLVGRQDYRNLDVVTLDARGVELTGRLTGADGPHVEFSADLADTTAAADARIHRVLARIDDYIERSGLTAEVLDAEPLPKLSLPEPSLRLDLRADGVTSVIWATGHRRSYPWLRVPVLDKRGEICHRHGVTPVRGLYVLGQRFQRFRNSNFIDGVGRDAAFIADHLARRDAPLARL